jgi:putative transposase
MCLTGSLHFQKNMTVGKTFVANTLREHQYEIQVMYKKIKHVPPKSIARQLIWGVDLTFKQTTHKDMLPILGVVEHHSRKSLTLSALKDKTTITLLAYLFAAIKQYGKPKIIRTDNEAVFTSKLFTLLLWLLGIKHQTTDLHSPWQNGRVERFFGTLKLKLNQWSVESLEAFNQDLHIFRFWYNNVRTHNNLKGKTPEEVWNNTSIQHYTADNTLYFNEWEGLLSGFYHPP